MCGGSAITATGSAIKAPQEEQALAISLVSFFTIFYMLALPYIAQALGIDPAVAAAWIGGCVSVCESVSVSACLSLCLSLCMSLFCVCVCVCVCVWYDFMRETFRYAFD